MVMGLFTMLVLAGALAVKFLTSRHKESLEVEKIEVDNERRRLGGIYDQAYEAHREAEDRLRTFQHDKAQLEQHLKDAEEELEERIKRNEELQGG